MNWTEIIVAFVMLALAIWALRNLGGWAEIRRLPKWVQRAQNRWESRLRVQPYDAVKYFKGKNYVYKIWYETIGQGQIREHYYKKKRN